MSQVEAAILTLQLVNTAAGLTASLIEKARAEGATPEQLAAARASAVARFDAAAAAVAAAEPPAAITEGG